MNKIIVPNNGNQCLGINREDILESLKDITDKQIETLGMEIDDTQNITDKQIEKHKNEINETYVQGLESGSIWIPEKIIEYRKNWMSDLDIIKKNKYKIENAVGKIPHKYEICDDGSVITIMKVGNKTYKIIDLNLKLHTDEKYLFPHSLLKDNEEVVLDNSKTYVEETGMEGNFVGNWKNKKLRKCIIKLGIKGFSIVDSYELEELLDEIGTETGIMRNDDKMAMLMYLTGMEGEYRLKIMDGSSIRNQILLGKENRFFASGYARHSGASIFMLSCKKN